MTTRVFYNPRADRIRSDPTIGGQALEFHQRLPGYQPTPLAETPALASALGLGRVWVKDESSRLGLPAFKILGASWATYRALAQRMGDALAPWGTVRELAQHLRPLLPMTLATATDGNHGRAVAHMAALLGCDARIFVPAGTVPARIQAIEGEGATVVVVDGSYDDAVVRAAEMAGAYCLVISDTAWPGYEDVPRWVLEGYGTICREIDAGLAAQGEGAPDVVLVQIGVGALAAAVVQHYRRADRATRPKIVGVEPVCAACALASMEAGQIVTIAGPHDSIMAGLNCGTPSPVAWPLVSGGIDLFVAIDDEWARWAMRALAAEGIVAGETGAAGVAGLAALMADEKLAELRAALGLQRGARVLALCTEGATDPGAYREIVGGAAGQA